MLPYVIADLKMWNKLQKQLNAASHNHSLPFSTLLPFHGLDHARIEIFMKHLDEEDEKDGLW